jgi:hypothetical protein
MDKSGLDRVGRRPSSQRMNSTGSPALFVTTRFAACVGEVAAGGLKFLLDLSDKISSGGHTAYSEVRNTAGR